MRDVQPGLVLLDSDGIYLGMVTAVVAGPSSAGYLVAGCDARGRRWRVPLGQVRWVVDEAVRLSVPYRLLLRSVRP
jgi:hypothetical protein